MSNHKTRQEEAGPILATWSRGATKRRETACVQISGRMNPRETDRAERIRLCREDKRNLSHKERRRGQD